MSLTRQQKKEAGLVTATVILSALVMWQLASAVGGGVHPLTAALLIMVVLAWTAVMALSLALAASRASWYALVLGPPLVVAIVGLARVGAIVAALILILCLAAARRSLTGEISNRIKYRTKQIFSKGVRLLLIGLAAVLAGFSADPFISNLRISGFHIPPELVETALQPAQGIIANMLPGYTPSSRVDELIEQQIRAQSGQLSPEQPVTPGQLAAVRRQLSRTYGLPITGRETVPQLITMYVNRYLNNLTQAIPLLITVLALSAFLLVARLVIPVLVWPVLGITYLLIRAGQRVNFLFLITVQESVERLRL